MISTLPRRPDGLRLASSLVLWLALGRCACPCSDLALLRERRRRSCRALAARERCRVAGPGCARDGCGCGPAARPGAQARPQQPADRRSGPLQRHPRLHDDALGRGHAGADACREARCPRAPSRTRGRVGLGARQAAIADLQRDTALAWLERSYQESLRELLRAQIAQAELQVQAAETLYRSGKGSQAEVFAARGSVEQLRDGLAQVERQVAVAAPSSVAGSARRRRSRWRHAPR
jgi:hypothetical protein